MTPESTRDIYTVDRGWRRFRWNDTGWVDEGPVPGPLGPVGQANQNELRATPSRALDPSFNTPRTQEAPWTTPTKEPIGFALANTVEGDVVPIRGWSAPMGTVQATVRAANTLKVGDPIYITSSGYATSYPQASSSKRKEGKLPKYTSVTTKSSGFTFRVTAKIPHPSLDNLVMIPVEGDLFTVERDDEWKIGDTAMYIAPGTHFCGPNFVEEYFPAVRFLSKSGAGCVNVGTKVFAGVPSRGFLVKPPKRLYLNPNATPDQTYDADQTYDIWCGEQRVAANAAATEKREAKKKEEAARLERDKRQRDEILQREAELIGKDAEKRFLARANGSYGGFNTIRMVNQGGTYGLEVEGLDGKWVPLTHVKVRSSGAAVVDGGVIEIARW